MKREGRKARIIIQVAILFLIGIILTGVLTYVSEKRLSSDSVNGQTEAHAARIADEVKRAVKEFPAYQSLIRFWYEHPDILDPEYDAGFEHNEKTLDKCRELAAKHPEIQLRYVDDAGFAAMSDDTKITYAEIAYSWLITRVDQIKQGHRADYLFCVISEEPFDRQFFLFSAAEPGAVRGTNYEEVYPLGHVVSVTLSQADAMRNAVDNEAHLADAGDYVDYYSRLISFDGHEALIGLTYDYSALNRSMEAETRTGAKLAILNQLALSAICLGLIYYFVLRPLKKVQKSVRAYKTTEDSGSVIEGLAEVRTQNEIGQLACDVSEMVRQIEDNAERIKSITAEKERIGTELELARRIQNAMLPSKFPAFPERSEFDLHAEMDPAKEVGGDFYDFFLIDDDHLGLVMADVSGKGIPAALFMMISKILIKNAAMAGMSPAATLRAVNERISANNPEQMFVTVWLGILEISTGRLTAANAGHEYPMLCAPGGEFAFYTDKHGFVIGGLQGIKYREYELMLEPGSKLFLYTDGVPEATDNNNLLFGAARMLEALNADPEASPKELLKAMRAAVDDFVGEAEQFDDLTMLCFEYKKQLTTDN